jgi:hypothetical protein
MCRVARTKQSTTTCSAQGSLCHILRTHLSSDTDTKIIPSSILLSALNDLEYQASGNRFQAGYIKGNTYSVAGLGSNNFLRSEQKKRDSFGSISKSAISSSRAVKFYA